MIEIVGLKKIYSSKNQPQVNALDGVDLVLDESGMTFLLGKSGSGKSTMLNLLGGLDNYTEGDIIIDGKSTKDFTQADFDNYRNEYVGFVFQDYNLLDDLTVGKNLSLALEMQSEIATDEEIELALSLVGLEGYAKRKTTELSGGQKQRLALARALVRQPRILILDDCTSSLDAGTEAAVLNGLRQRVKGVTVLLISQRISTVMRTDRILCLENGVVQGYGTHKELLAGCPTYQAIYASQIGGDADGR
jgi:ABC-type multidrug transport system fused ATPase/permease subunit